MNNLTSVADLGGPFAPTIQSAMGGGDGGMCPQLLG